MEDKRIRQRLWDAINSDNVDRVRNILEENCVDPDIMLCNETLPLLFLAKSYKMVKMLVEKDVDVEPLRWSSSLIRLFSYALYTEESFEILKLLVKKGADVYKRCDNGYDVMDYAKKMYVPEGNEQRQKLKDETIEFLKKYYKN